MPLNDERIMPIYEKAEELGMVIFVHTGWSGYFLLKNQHPLLLDDVAVRFPDLKLVVVHAGENYYEEVVMMMLKNPNMYANTGWWGFPPTVGNQHPVSQVRQAFHGARQVPMGNG